MSPIWRNFHHCLHWKFSCWQLPVQPVMTILWKWHFGFSVPVSNIAVHIRWTMSLQWRHNGLDSVSNHQRHNCLLSRLFGRRSKKTSKLRVTVLCAGNSPGTGEFPTQRASNADNVSIWWRHHVLTPKRWPVTRNICLGYAYVYQHSPLMYPYEYIESILRYPPEPGCQSQAISLGLGLQVLYSITNCTGNILGRFTNITSNRTRLQCSRYKQYTH